VENEVGILELFEQSCRKYGRRLAIRYKNKKIKYSALNKKSSRLAAGLIENLGLRSGDKVAILLNNSPEFIISLLAVLKTGATAVPVNTFLKKEEIDFIISDSQVKIIITATSFLEKAGIFAAKQGSHRPLVLLTDQPSAGCSFINDVFLKQTDVLSDLKKNADDIALIIYTSGTTGRPKGAMLSSGNLASNVIASKNAIEIGTKDRFLLVLPMFHSFTITVCILLPLIAGAGIVILPSLKPFHHVIRSVVFNRITIIVGIPQLFRIFSELELPRFLSFFLAVRLCISGAAALDEKTYYLFSKKFKIPLLEGYGLSEASPVVSLNPLNGIQKVGSVGLPFTGVEVKVVDSEERELPAGQVGELIVRGPNVMRGYYNLPQETTEALKNGWLFTGDMARIDEDGYIYIVDRKKDMIISHGMNIYPAEIERVIMQHAKVKETAVLGRPDKHRGEIPVCFIILKEGAELTHKEIIDYCKDKLANYKIPHQVKFIDEFPRTPTGKILKKDLKT